MKFGILLLIGIVHAAASVRIYSMFWYAGMRNPGAANDPLLDGIIIGAFFIIYAPVLLLTFVGINFWGSWLAIVPINSALWVALLQLVVKLIRDLRAGRGRSAKASPPEPDYDDLLRRVRTRRGRSEKPPSKADPRLSDEAW